MKLSAGERYPLTDEKMYIVLTSGEAEVYAVTKQQDSFRQMFLTELSPGEAAFPSMDEFGMVDVVVYAVEDAELDLLPLAEGEPSSLVPLMKQWFGRLVELPWLRLLADRGDDMLKTWADGSTLDGKTTDMTALSKTFAENEGISAMLLGVRFKSQDKQRGERLKGRAKRQRRLVDETISGLLGEELPPEDGGGTDNAKVEAVAFLVRCAAQAMKSTSRRKW